MNYFSNLFDKELYMFRTDLLSIIRSLNTVYTVIGICHDSYVDCLLARLGWNILTSLAGNRHNWRDKYLLLRIQCWDSWWWAVDLSETCRVLYQNKFEKPLHALQSTLHTNVVRLTPWPDFDIQIPSLVGRQGLATYGRKIQVFLLILLVKNKGVFDLLDDVTTILRDLGIYWPVNTVWPIVRLQSLATSLSELQMSQIRKCWRVPQTCPESWHWP